MEFSSNLFQDTVRELESQSESLRIKKLILYLCKKSWESDLDTLNRFSLEELLAELLIVKPTIEELTASVHKVIRKINRPQLYKEIAETVLEKLTALYQQQATTIDNSPSLADKKAGFDDLLNSVVANLTNHPEKKRIKKLIIAAHKTRWEKDLKVIEKCDLKQLILELYHLNPQPRELELSLSTIVRRLNKSEVYSKISQIILNQIKILYAKQWQEGTTEGITKIFKDRNSLVNNFPKSAEKKAKLLELEILNTEWEEDLIPVESKNLPRLSTKRYNLFELRREVVQYTNPLRSKMLLFSLLDPSWLQRRSDWSILNQFTLDGLLKEFLQVSREGRQLEAELYDAAKLLPDPEASRQTARTLMEIIQPIL